MNKTAILLAALLGTATMAVQAQELYVPGYQAPANGSTLSRDQVKQSVLQQSRNGGLSHNDVDLPAVAQPAEPFGKTRAQAKQEVLAARATGGLDHNDVDLPQVAKGSVRTRQEVRAEAIAANKLPRTAPGKNTIDY